MGAKAKMAKKKLLQSSPEILSGAIVFAGTRVTVQTMFDYLEAGDSLNEFLDDFPTVSRERAVEVLEIAKQSLLVRSDETAA